MWEDFLKSVIWQISKWLLSQLLLYRSAFSTLWLVSLDQIILYIHWNSRMHVCVFWTACVTVWSGCLQAHRGPSGFCFSFVDTILHQLQSAGADCSVQHCGWFLPLWTTCVKHPQWQDDSSPKTGCRSCPLLCWGIFLPQSPSLSLASSVKYKQEVVKYPPWTGRGNRTGSGDWTPLWPAGQLEGSTVNYWRCYDYALLCWTLFVDRCQKRRDLAWGRNFCSCVGTLEAPLITKREKPQSRHKQEKISNVSAGRAIISAVVSGEKSQRW